MAAEPMNVSEANFVEECYSTFKQNMTTLASVGIDLTIDANAELVGSLVMAAYTDNKDLKESDSYDVLEIKVDKERKTYSVAVVKKNINIGTIKPAIASIMSADETRKRWMPFLAALQLAVKTKDSILWQDSRTTKSLGVSPICEPFAIGYNVKNKLKKSRQLSFGPLVHLDQLMRLDNESRNKRKLRDQSVREIRKRLIGTLKRQSIGSVQRAILNEIEAGRWEHINSLCVSYCSIKPHIEHHFVLTYPFIANTTSFTGANFTDEWVWKTVKACKMMVMGPSQEWMEFLQQVHIHCCFQTAGEDLGALSAIFGRTFVKRRSLGKFVKRSLLTTAAEWAFDYRVWTKPQRGAPRSIESSVRGQICSRPSLRGTRNSLNNFGSLSDLDYTTGTDGVSDIVQALNQEFEEFKKLQEEGTDKFFTPNGNNVSKTPIVNNGVYLMSN